MIEKLMTDGIDIVRVEQNSIEHQQLLKKYPQILSVTPYFFNSDSGYYLRGGTYATYYNLNKLINGGQVIDYEKKMYYGEDLDKKDKETSELLKPTTMSMARGLAGQMWNSVKGKAQGDDIFVTEEKAEMRWGICQECPLLDKVLNRCKSCGCFMKVKVHLEHTACPEKKW
jgi:hypothetical protein